MNSKLWIHKALTMCLMIALTATYSMVALASPGNAIGELMVTGSSSDQNVTVNGEAAKSGRTIFSSSTIATPDGLGAIVNLGKAGKISFSPNSTFRLVVDGTTVSGDLTAGSITVLSAPQSVNVKTLNGEVVQANVGDTVSADAAAAAQQNTPKAGHHDALIFGVILAGALAIILWTAHSDNRVDLGGSSITVSPTR